MTIPGNLHITSTSHGGYIAVATALLTVWMLLFYFTRVFIRLRFTSWGPDDWAITIGTGLALFQVSCVFVAIHNGFGLVGNLLMEGQHRTIEKVRNLLQQCQAYILTRRQHRISMPHKYSISQRYAPRSARLLFSSSASPGQKVTSWLHAA